MDTILGRNFCKGKAANDMKCPHCNKEVFGRGHNVEQFYEEPKELTPKEQLQTKIERLEKEKIEQKELIDRLCSQEPCPKCGYGVTGACYGCEIVRLQTEVKQLEKRLKDRDLIFNREHDKNIRLGKVVASVADYKHSDLFKEWQEYIKATPTAEQIDFFVYQQRAAIQALKDNK